MVKDDEFGIVTFWLTYGKQCFQLLSEVTMRIYTTPVSSSASEGHFSVVNEIVRPERSRLKEDLVEDLVYLRSSLGLEAARKES